MIRLDRIIDKFGEDVTVLNSGIPYETKGIIQPLERKRRLTDTNKRLPTGRANIGKYYAIFPPDVVLTQGSAIRTSENSYYPRSSGSYKVKGNTVYVWAVLSALTAQSGDDYD